MDTKALRQKILDLAIRGKLVPQDPNDEPASVLLERIRAEKQQMVKDGKLKPKDIKNDTIIFVGEDNLLYVVLPFLIPILVYILNFNIFRGFLNVVTSVKKLSILIESYNFNTESAFLGVNENEVINNVLIRYLFSVRNLLSNVV